MLNFTDIRPRQTTDAASKATRVQLHEQLGQPSGALSRGYVR